MYYWKMENYVPGDGGNLELQTMICIIIESGAEAGCLITQSQSNIDTFTYFCSVESFIYIWGHYLEKYIYIVYGKLFLDDDDVIPGAILKLKLIQGFKMLFPGMSFESSVQNNVLECISKAKSLIRCFEFELKNMFGFNCDGKILREKLFDTLNNDFRLKIQYDAPSSDRGLRVENENTKNIIRKICENEVGGKTTAIAIKNRLCIESKVDDNNTKYKNETSLENADDVKKAATGNGQRIGQEIGSKETNDKGTCLNNADVDKLITAVNELSTCSDMRSKGEDELREKKNGSNWKKADIAKNVDTDKIILLPINIRRIRRQIKHKYSANVNSKQNIYDEKLNNIITVIYFLLRLLQENYSYSVLVSILGHKLFFAILFWYTYKNNTKDFKITYSDSKQIMPADIFSNEDDASMRADKESKEDDKETKNKNSTGDENADSNKNTATNNEQSMRADMGPKEDDQETKNKNWTIEETADSNKKKATDNKQSVHADMEKFSDEIADGSKKKVTDIERRSMHAIHKIPNKVNDVPVVVRFGQTETKNTDKSKCQILCTWNPELHKRLLDEFLEDYEKKRKCKGILMQLITHDGYGRFRQGRTFVRPLTYNEVNMFLDMNIYLSRVSAFFDWPKNVSLSFLNLARAEFIFDGKGQDIRGLFCGIDISNIPAEFEPLQFHREQNNNFYFLESLEIGNIFIENTVCNNTVKKAQEEDKTQSYVDITGTRTTQSQHNQSYIYDNILTSDKTTRPLNKVNSGNNLQVRSNAHVNRNDWSAKSRFSMQKNTQDGDRYIPNSSYNIKNEKDTPSWSVDTNINSCDNILGAAKHPQCIGIENRLVSFKGWPYRHIKEPKYFADAGFFYTGEKDIVRCFFCGIALVEWISTDDPWVEHARHSQNCLFLIEKRGQNFIEDILTTWKGINYTKHNGLKDSDTRLRTFENWPSTLAELPDQLISAGFYYTGQEDVVRCFCCDIGLAEWKLGDDPWIEHARHSPNCLFLLEKRGGEFIEDVHAKLRQRQIYCPDSSEIEELNARIRSFKNWPSSTGQNPDQLALAGFYYAGEHDTVRCHYCDGGISGLKEDDRPLEEHARWFPNCKFVMKMKGLAYVEEIARQDNDITNSRPTE